MRYAGLTDEPARRKREQGNPRNFSVMQQFTCETAARQWERRMLAQGYEEDTSGKGWVYVNDSSYFDGMPQHVWEFHVGGYQVCHKWLDDRRKAGRSLSDDDIAHYHKIVVAITETIKIMKQIDETITAHDGWPIAFSGPSSYCD